MEPTRHRGGVIVEIGNYLSILVATRWRMGPIDHLGGGGAVGARDRLVAAKGVDTD